MNIPLSCSAGDYKSKLQLYRDRRGHPQKTSLPLSFLRLLLPSLLPHHSIAQMDGATDSLTWDCDVPSRTLSLRSRTGPI